MASSKREQLVDTALKLFRQHGFHATGIDRILAEAGVAKMTLYKHFASKDALIQAAIKKREIDFSAWFSGRVQHYQSLQADGDWTPVTALFDTLAEWVADKPFVGCTFINASAEYHQADDPIHTLARQHKQQVGKLIAAQLRMTPAAAVAKTLAPQLQLLLEGSIVMAHTANDEQAVAHGKTAAIVLCRAQAPT